MSVSEDGKAFQSEDKIMEPDGKESTWLLVIRVEGETLAVQARNRSLPGLPPEGPVYGYKREAAPAERAEASATAPALLKEYGKRMVVQWECKSAVPWIAVPGTSTVAIRATCSWTPDGSALKWSAQIGEGSEHALVGWDPESKRLKEFVVASTGDCFLLFVAKDGDKWVTTAELTMPDGKRKTIRAVTTFDKDGNRHVNEYPTHQDVFTRLKTK